MTAQQIDVHGLPALPEAKLMTVLGNDAWTAEQMREYGAACVEAALRQSGEAVATIHRDGFYTFPAGRDPFDRFGPNANRSALKVYAAPPATSGLVEALPDTFLVISAPCWPGGIPLRSMDEALRFIAEHGNEQTRLATWCHQYQRRDYTVEETKAMVAAHAARGGA